MIKQNSHHFIHLIQKRVEIVYEGRMKSFEPYHEIQPQ